MFAVKLYHTFIFLFISKQWFNW